MNTFAIRINARLLGEDAERFVELQQTLGNRPASDLLRDALREYDAPTSSRDRTLSR
jgi:Ribbon-helix-helix protein, copG family